MQNRHETELQLSPLSRGETDRVLHLSLPVEQQTFAGAIETAVADDDPAVDFHMGVVADQPVAFFKIDRDYRRKISTAPLEDCGYLPGDLGLRAMMVGQQFQGRGYGKAVMAGLKSYLRAHYPAQHVFLTVNCRNKAAIHLYRAGGWTDTGQLYLGGRAGPQHVFRLDLG
ncbi:RimJ/RimL family protein N-acetyltransferase [Agrobacterium vitis]|nr:RimJ/RimL family protein N-acetyltransferase [Agrobacterium vitis]MBE1439792.1 RimJ/RimL family protein N-acetyltransferase [Agrobacterium vitis]